VTTRRQKELPRFFAAAQNDMAEFVSIGIVRFPSRHPLFHRFEISINASGEAKKCHANTTILLKILIPCWHLYFDLSVYQASNISGVFGVIFFPP
jgi:hypothetical protein